MCSVRLIFIQIIIKKSQYFIFSESLDVLLEKPRQLNSWNWKAQHSYFQSSSTLRELSLVGVRGCMEAQLCSLSTLLPIASTLFMNNSHVAVPQGCANPCPVIWDPDRPWEESAQAGEGCLG